MNAPMTEARERPILFSGEMVRAILDGRKSQTRRVVRPHNSEFGSWGRDFWAFADLAHAWVDGRGSGSEYLHVPAKDSRSVRDAGMDGVVDRLRPRIAPAFAFEQDPDPESGYVPPASRLWVRESHYVWSAGYTDGTGRHIVYRATEPDAPNAWTPSIHMPRFASRITLEVTGVRVERVQDISEDDAVAEGCDYEWHGVPVGASDHYRMLWDMLNAKRGYGWDANPWVWVIEFRRVEAA